jgi:DNA-binding winged helix-turn-helix (wHTH) protein
VKGQVRELEPKVFDVLAYLAAHHARVVGRQELLDAIWTRGGVSDAVVATSVMKARRAIGDTDPHLPIIRTVHRVGYRLAIEVSISTMDAGDSGIPDSEAMHERIATLPFQNLTGRPGLIWIEYGLSALLAQSLAERSDLHVVPTLEVLVLAEGVGRNMTPRTCARLVSNSLAAKYVISTQMRASGKQLELAYCVFHDTRILRVGSLYGSDPVELALNLGEKICDDVLHATTLLPSSSLGRSS